MRPKLLLVEDDPTTRAFLHAATQALDVDVDLADSMQQALTLVAQTRHAGWLLDARLPDGSGVELLERLRQSHPDIPALAHTAASNPDELQQLRDCGFDAAVRKPLSVTDWQTAVRALLALQIHPESQTTIPLWDDATALKALGGDHEVLKALRQLFLQELPQQIQSLERANADKDQIALKNELHKLTASCGFVGAARLATAIGCWRNAPGTITNVLHTARATLTTAP